VADVNTARDDSVTWRGRSGTARIEPYVAFQLQHHYWLPTSVGPRPVKGAFARRSGYSIIAGSHGAELGDRLLPYVVVDSVDRLADLQAVGVEILEDLDAALASALMRALATLGQSLSSVWVERRSWHWITLEARSGVHPGDLSEVEF